MVIMNIREIVIHSHIFMKRCSILVPEISIVELKYCKLLKQ